MCSLRSYLSRSLISFTNILVFTFVIKDAAEKSPPLQVILGADLIANEIAFRSGIQEIDEEMQTRVMKDADRRLRLRQEWISRMQKLVDDANAIASEGGWSTRQLSKTLDDREFGKHQVPALLLQKDLCQLMLEPHGRTAPGIEGGFAGIYLMPAYDDAASLYFYDGRWNIHVRKASELVVARVAEGEALPFNMQNLRDVLGRLHSNGS